VFHPAARSEVARATRRKIDGRPIVADFEPRWAARYRALLLAAIVLIILGPRDDV